MRVVITSDDKEIRRAFERLLKLGRSPRTVLQRMGLWLRRDGQRRLRARSVKPVYGKSTGKLSKSLTLAVEGDKTVYVGSALPYAAIQQVGGTVRPKTVKCLAIPTQKSLARSGVWPRDWPRGALRFVPNNKGGNVVGWLFGRHAGVKRAKDEMMYMLVRQSKIPGEAYLVPESNEFRSFALAELERAAAPRGSG